MQCGFLNRARHHARFDVGHEADGGASELEVALLGGVVEQLAHLSGLPHLAGPCS